MVNQNKMKGRVTLIIVWMIITLILALSVVGMLLFIGETIHYSSGRPGRHKSTWMEFGSKLLNSYLNG